MNSFSISFSVITLIVKPFLTIYYQPKDTLTMADSRVTASIHKNRATTLPRIGNFISSSRFEDANLVGRLYPNKIDASKSVERFSNNQIIMEIPRYI